MPEKGCIQAWSRSLISNVWGDVKGSRLSQCFVLCTTLSAPYQVHVVSFVGIYNTVVVKKNTKLKGNGTEFNIDQVNQTVKLTLKPS